MFRNSKGSFLGKRHLFENAGRTLHSLEFSAKVIEVMFDLSAMMIGVDGFVVFLVIVDQGVEVGGSADGGIDLVVIHQADEGELDGAACKGVH